MLRGHSCLIGEYCACPIEKRRSDMSTDSNRRLVRRFYEEVLNEQKFNLLDEIAVEDYVTHDPLPGMGQGREGLKDLANMLQALDPTYTIEDEIAEGDKVVVRWIQKGKSAGEFLGVPANGRSYRIGGIHIHGVKDGKLTEHWHVVDQLSLLQQLGVIPVPEAAR
jgi:steroid delta-isomerase-like uncharacterized protein